MAERAERAWKATILALLLAFGWMLVGATWMVFDLVARIASLRPGDWLGWPVGWFAAYLAAGWVMAGAAGVLLASQAREQGRTI